MSSEEFTKLQELVDRHYDEEDDFDLNRFIYLLTGR